MKATVRPLSVPLTAPFRIATGEVRTAENAVCTVSKDGITGIGEATPFEVITGGTQAKVLADLGRLAHEFPVADGEGVEAILNRLGAARMGSDARAALDVALHDWAAQKKGVPLATFLGGRPRALPTSVTIPIVELNEVPALVRQALDAKFRILKIKSRAGVETETQRIRQIRDLVGSQVELRVDANAGWTLAEAKKMLKVLRETDIRFLEQPLKRDDLAGHAELVKADQLPIMVDESVFTLADAQKVVAARAANLINVKLAKSGGIVEAGKILTFAETRGIDCMVGCMIQTRIATSQDAHVAAGFKAVKFVDLDGHTFLREDPVEGGVQIRNGELVFPEGNGHGARLAKAKLAAAN